MAEYKFNAQVNYGWGLSLNMTGKAPAVAKRIFSTYADALAYVNDYNDSAIEGLALAVFADSDATKNGLYFVAKIGTSTTDGETGVTSANNDGVLVKLETAGAADGSISDINDALDAINNEIGDPSSVGEGDVIVPSTGLYKVIEEAAAKAFTKVAKAQEEGHLNIEESTAADGSKTYTLSLVDVASAQALTDEIARAKEAEEGLDARVDVLEEKVGSAKVPAGEGVEETPATGLFLALDNETAARVAADEALQDKIDAVDDAIKALDATEGEASVAEGKHVAVQVTQVDGLITGVTVSENDIASAAALAQEILDREQAIEDAVSGINGTLADDDSKTLAAINDEIDTLQKDLNDLEAAQKSYSVSKLTEDELTELGDTNVKEAYKLVETVGESSAKVGDFIKIYKDSSLKSVSLEAENGEGTEGQFLKYTYIKADGSEEVIYVNVSEFLVQAEFKDGLAVSEAGEVSVKIDATSEGFLTVSADGVKLAGVQDAIDNAVAAEATLARAAEDKIEASVGLAADGSHVTATGNYTSGATTIVGEIAALDAQVKVNTDAIAQEVTDRTAAIEALDATVGSQEIAEGKHVAVEVVETDGKLTALTVIEDDIASAQGLANEITRATQAEKAITDRLDVIEGTAEGSIKKAVADAKSELLGDAAEDYNTLGKLEDKVIAAEAAAKAAATKITEKTTGHVTVSSVTDETTGAITYTISENDIASAQALTDETARATKAEEDINKALAQEVTDRGNAITAAVEALDADVTSAEKVSEEADAASHKVRVQVVETDGKITAVNVTESDIASAADLNGVDGRVQTLEAATHTHDNKAALDTITQEMIDTWNTFCWYEEDEVSEPGNGEGA